MVSMLDQARGEYKATYDELIKFEQDHCTVDAASVSWFSYLLHEGITFQVTIVPKLLKVDQKSALRELFVKCNKKDCCLNHIMSTARPIDFKFSNLLKLLILPHSLTNESFRPSVRACKPAAKPKAAPKATAAKSKAAPKPAPSDGGRKRGQDAEPPARPAEVPKRRRTKKSS